MTRRKRRPLLHNLMCAAIWAAASTSGRAQVVFIRGSHDEEGTGVARRFQGACYVITAEHTFRRSRDTVEVAEDLRRSYVAVISRQDAARDLIRLDIGKRRPHACVQWPTDARIEAALQRLPLSGVIVPASPSGPARGIPVDIVVDGAAIRVTPRDPGRRLTSGMSGSALYSDDRTLVGIIQTVEGSVDIAQGVRLDAAWVDVRPVVDGPPILRKPISGIIVSAVFPFSKPNHSPSIAGLHREGLRADWTFPVRGALGLSVGAMQFAADSTSGRFFTVGPHASLGTRHIGLGLFGEVGIGQQQTFYDDGGYYVESGAGSVYQPRLVEYRHSSALLGGGISTDLTPLILDRTQLGIGLFAQTGYWKVLVNGPTTGRLAGWRGTVGARVAR